MFNKEMIFCNTMLTTLELKNPHQRILTIKRQFPFEYMYIHICVCMYIYHICVCMASEYMKKDLACHTKSNSKSEAVESGTYWN